MDESTSIILQKLLDQTSEQTATLSRIETNQINMKTAFEKHVDEDKEVEKRVDKLEDGQKKVKWMALGAGAVVAGAWRVVEAMIWGGHQ